MEDLSSLIEPNDLFELLQNEQSFIEKFRLLEANFGKIAKNDGNDYQKGHIKNAIAFDAMNNVNITKLYPRDVPKIEDFSRYLGSLGISNRHHIIIYDRSEFGFLPSSRVWWIFRIYGHDRISILNGGINGWMAKGFELSFDVPVFKTEEFNAKLNNDLIRTYNQIIDNIHTNSEQLVDTRPSEEFSSTSSNSITSIPNSINFPYYELYDKKTRSLKNQNELLQTFLRHGLELNKPLSLTCKTGTTACITAFAAYIIGLKNVPIYMGSWTEYSQRQNLI